MEKPVKNVGSGRVAIRKSMKHNTAASSAIRKGAVSSLRVASNKDTAGILPYGMGKVVLTNVLLPSEIKNMKTSFKKPARIISRFSEPQRLQ